MSTNNTSSNTTEQISTNNDALSKAMALNLADWHVASLKPYGIESFYSDSLWWRRPGASPIYLGAIILDRQSPDNEVFAGLQTVQELWGDHNVALYDCSGTYDLTQIGYTRVVKNPWFWRPPAAQVALDLPAGLTIEIVKTPQQLADFERATMEGFEEPADPQTAFRDRQTFSQHAAETIEDEAMVYLNARLEGQVVASVIIHRTVDMLGVYGISTLIPFRRRGYAAALMRAATALRPDLPISVFPDPVSVPIYTVLGFAPAGEVAIWNSRAV